VFRAKRASPDVDASATVFRVDRCRQPATSAVFAVLAATAIIGVAGPAGAQARPHQARPHQTQPHQTRPHQTRLHQTRLHQASPARAADRTSSTSASVPLSVVPGHGVRFDVVADDQGLPSASVFGVVQDRRGFLWFATGEGLARYDGYATRVFRYARDDENSLTNNSMVGLITGRDGALWLATIGGGVDRFDPGSERFTHYRHDPVDPRSLSGNSVQRSGLVEDRTGMIWVATRDSGLNRIDPVTGRVTRYRHIPNDETSLSSDRLHAAYVDSAGMLWIGTGGAGLNRVDPTTGRITRYLPDPANSHTVPNASITALFEDREGRFWVGTNSGFGTFDRRTGTFTPYPIGAGRPDEAALNSVNAFLEDQAGTLWLGTAGAGLLRFDRDRRVVTQYVTDPADPNTLRNNVVSSLHQDPSGTIWVGTLGGGANTFSGRPEKFAHYKHEPGNPNSVANNSILSIFEDHAGTLWIGTDSSLNRWDRRTNTWRVYRDDPVRRGSLSNGSVTAIAEDSDGTLWFGTFLGGLNHYDPKTDTFTTYRYDAKNPRSLGDDIVRSLHRDKQGRLWVGGWNNGLSLFDPATGDFQRYTRDPGRADSLSSGAVTDIYEDSAGALWVATEGGGLDRFAPSTRTFTHFLNDPRDPRSLPDNTVNVLYEDRSGRFWVGTASGLCAFDRATGTCTLYNDRNGMPDNTVQGILEDPDGRLWISTEHGLTRFDPLTKTFRNYDVRDGLQGNEFNHFSAFYASPRTGEMYFGGTNGFNVIDPDKATDNSFVPPVVLTEFRLFDTPVQHGHGPVLTKVITETTRMTLQHDQNSVSFEFSALSYVAPEKNRYRYWLQGFDSGWRTADSAHRIAVYTNLDPGHYVFRVQGTNEDGIWNDEGATVDITVLPPWWATWWFRLLAAGALVCAAYGAYRLRLRAMRRRNAELEQQIAQRSAELEEVYQQARELERQQAQESRLKSIGQLAAGIAHEINTPLQFITDNTRFVQESAATLLERCRSVNPGDDEVDFLAEELPPALAESLDGLARVTEIVRAMKDFSHPGTQREDSDLNRAAQTTVQVCSNEWRPVARVDLDLDPEAGLVSCYEGEIKQVLLNLVVNAAHAIDETRSRRGDDWLGTITVATRRTGDEFVISVGDDGIGMDDEVRQRIFDPFFTTKEVGRGTGQGLSIARDVVVSKHGGQIDVHSTLGAGTTFVVRLPLVRTMSDTNATG
jgi:ligand-binding sensor domain-containing protein/signal transduction histidine kinase